MKNLINNKDKLIAKITTPPADLQLARRLYRLPKEHKSVILQLLNKCEYISSQDILQQHIKNADNLLGNLVYSDDGMVRNKYVSVNKSNIRGNIIGNDLQTKEIIKLPKVKKKYVFINKKTGKQLSLEQIARKYGKSTSTIYGWIYKGDGRLAGWEVI